MKVLITATLICFAFTVNAATIVIKGGNLIDVRRGISVADTIIVIEGERITKIGNSKEINVANAEIVDASGEWIVPGFMDMHSHVTRDENVPLQMYLAKVLRQFGIRVVT
jgi:imidazolonepropionase-like amidohydrolase